MTVNLAKLRTQATITAVPEGGAWVAFARFGGHEARGVSLSKEGAIDFAIHKLALAIESLADAIRGVTDSAES